MIVSVDLESGTVRVEGSDDFGELHIAAAAGGDIAAVAETMGGTTGRPNHVWFPIESLREWAGGAARDEAWREGFAAMIEYARSHGWVDDAGRVEAHVEWG